MIGFSPKQMQAFAKSYARINIAEGAVSSGKSHVFMYRFLDEIRKGPLGDGATGFDFMIGGKSESSVIRNVLRPLDRELGGILRYNHSQRYFDLWGNRCYIVGANDERAEGKIRGWTLAGALIDEATLSPQSFFKMTLSRLRVQGAKMLATTNPDSKFHWLKTDFLDKFADDPTELATFKFKLDDNPYLSQHYKDSLKKEYSGLWYRRFIEGEWVQAEGAIFDFFDHDIHTVNEAPTYAKYFLLGVDYGTTNPFAAVLVGFNDDNHPALWVEKEYYWDSKAMGYSKTDAEYAQDIKREFGGYPIKQVYLDPSAQSFEIELRRQKWPVKQAKNEVLDGIRAVSTWLSQGDLVIKRSCINLLKEFESYVWDEKSIRLGEDKPVKQRDHALDALRYVLFSHYGHKHSLKELTREDAYYAAEKARFGHNPMAYPGFAAGAAQGWQVQGGRF
jgi:PBSX family phage terminase large subunit